MNSTSYYFVSSESRSRQKTPLSNRVIPPQLSMKKTRSLPKTVRVGKRTQAFLRNFSEAPKNFTQINKMISTLNSLYKMHITSKEYPEAQLVQRKIQFLEKRLQATKSEPKLLFQKRNDLLTKIENLENEKNEILSQLQTANEKEIDEMKQRQEKEINAFSFRKQKKVSSEFIDQKNKEKKMALSHNFLAAEKIRRKNLKFQETLKQNELKGFADDIDRELDRIVEKHLIQKNLLLEHHESVKQNVIQKFEQTAEVHRRRIFSIEKELREMFQNKDFGEDLLGQIAEDEQKNEFVQQMEKVSTPRLIGASLISKGAVHVADPSFSKAVTNQPTMFRDPLPDIIAKDEVEVIMYE